MICKASIQTPFIAKVVKLFFLFFVLSCEKSIFFKTHDSTQIQIQTLSLFNQQSVPKFEKSWKDDWILRRERLGMLAKELNDNPYELLLFQEVMSKKDSIYNDDEAILKSKLLQNYHWQNVEAERFVGSDEIEHIAIVSKQPFLLPDVDEISSWQLDQFGTIIFSKLAIEDQFVGIFNANLKDNANLDEVLPKITRIISSMMKVHKICSKRIILGGYFGLESSKEIFAQLLNALKMKDSSDTFCDGSESNCQTYSAENTLLATINPEAKGTQSDRIFVPLDSIVYTSKRNFDNPKRNNLFVNIKKYGLSELYMSDRFGFSTTIKLPRCSTSANN